MDKSAIIKALREGGQAMSAGIADSALGGPIDFLSEGLRFAGVPIPDNAAGSSKWLREKGVVVDAPSNPLTEAAYAAGYAPTQMMQIPQAVGPMVKSLKGMIPK